MLFKKKKGIFIDMERRLQYASKCKQQLQKHQGLV